LNALNRINNTYCSVKTRDRRGRDPMVVRFTTTYVISEFESYSWRVVLDTTLCDKVCQ